MEDDRQCMPHNCMCIVRATCCHLLKPGTDDHIDIVLFHFCCIFALFQSFGIVFRAFYDRTTIGLDKHRGTENVSKMKLCGDQLNGR